MFVKHEKLFNFVKFFMILSIMDIHHIEVIEIQNNILNVNIFDFVLGRKQHQIKT